MKKLGVILVVAAAFLTTALLGGATAQMRQGAFTLSPMGGGYEFDDSVDEEDEARDLLDLGRTVTLGLGYNFTKSLAAELLFSYVHTDADVCCGDNDVYAYLPRLNFLYHLNPDGMFVPYVSIGGGYMAFDDDTLSPGEIDETAVADGGVGVKYFLTENLAVRGDAHYYYGFEDSTNDFSFQAGIVYQIGGVMPDPGPCDDTDNDGVCDDEDQCPNTPAGVRVDSVGCQVRSEPYDVMERGEEETEVLVVEEEPEVVVVVEEEEPEPMEVTVYFEFDQTNVKQLYHKRLTDLADYMMEYPGMTATIEGHTDSVGGESYNMELSRERARALRDFMVRNHGIRADRFDLVGYGETRPAVPNDSPENRALNRRAITITIME